MIILLQVLLPGTNMSSQPLKRGEVNGSQPHHMMPVRLRSLNQVAPDPDYELCMGVCRVLQREGGLGGQFPGREGSLADLNSQACGESAVQPGVVTNHPPPP